MITASTRSSLHASSAVMLLVIICAAGQVTHCCALRSRTCCGSALHAARCPARPHSCSVMFVHVPTLFCVHLKAPSPPAVSHAVLLAVLCPARLVLQGPSCKVFTLQRLILPTLTKLCCLLCCTACCDVSCKAPQLLCCVPVLFCLHLKPPRPPAAA
jgi:hypothetical protein